MRFHDDYYFPVSIDTLSFWKMSVHLHCLDYFHIISGMDLRVSHLSCWILYGIHLPANYPQQFFIIDILYFPVPWRLNTEDHITWSIVSSGLHFGLDNDIDDWLLEAMFGACFSLQCLFMCIVLWCGCIFLITIQLQLLWVQGFTSCSS